MSTPYRSTPTTASVEELWTYDDDNDEKKAEEVVEDGDTIISEEGEENNNNNNFENNDNNNFHGTNNSLPPCSGGNAINIAKAGIFGTSSNLINTIVGAGIVGIPYALKESGFIAGVLLLIFVGVMTGMFVYTN